jgi:hypothetical protein
MKRKELKRKTIATIEACKPGVKNETERNKTKRYRQYFSDTKQKEKYFRKRETKRNDWSKKRKKVISISFDNTKGYFEFYGDYFSIKILCWQKSSRKSIQLGLLQDFIKVGTTIIYTSFV